MATYTDPEKFRTDTMIVSDDRVRERVLMRAAVMAYNVINAKLSGIYTVPFSATYPPIIVDISDLLTKTFALMFTIKRGGPNIKAKDHKQNEGALAMQMLEDIRNGTMDIPDVSRLSTRGGYHNMDGYTRVFDLDEPYSHMPDDDYLDDLADERD